MSRQPLHIIALAALAAALLHQGEGLCAPSKTVTIGSAKYSVLPVKLAARYDLTLTVTPLAKTVAPAAKPAAKAKGKAQPKPPAKPATAVLPVRLIFAAVDARNYYALAIEPKAVTLAKVVAGKATTLARTAAAAAFAKPYALRIKRRRDLLTVVLNGRIVAECMDDSFAKGGAAIEMADRAPTLAGLRAQKVADIHETDDFMVAVDPDKAKATVTTHTAVIPSIDVNEVSGWDKVSGDWRLFSVLDEVRQVDDALLQERIATTDRKPDAARSANPFCLAGKAANGEGIVLSGYVFWDDYEYAASVNSHGSKFGLIFNHQGPNDYFLFEWSAFSERGLPRAVQLVRVSPKGRQVLATRYAPSVLDQWYRMKVRTYGRRIQCFLDDSLLFDLERDDAIGGRIGLWVRGAEPTDFDDVAVESTPLRRFDRATVLRRYARYDRKQWQDQADKATGTAAVRSLAPSPAPVVLGVPGWKQYRLAATVQARDAQAAAGLAIGPLAFQWDAKGLRLTWTNKGKTQTLASAPAAASLRAPRRVVLDTISPTHARVYIDGVLELRGRLPAPASGLAKLLASGAAGVSFSNIEVDFERQADMERPVSNMIFTEDPYMLHWSSPQGAWVPVGGNSKFWHKGDFFGSFAITFPAYQDAELLFCTDRTKPADDTSAAFEPNTGYALQCDMLLRKVSLSERGRKVKSASLPDGFAVRGPIRVVKDGQYVWVEAGGQEILEYRSTAAPKGRRVALKPGYTVDADYFQGVAVERDHVRDDYFDRAPVDWRKVGQWRIINRFACDPRWSHMTAWSENDLAILWTKAAYEGDFTLEFYAGNKMWPMRQWEGAQYYPRVGDINATICADGQDLDSGYTVTLAEWDNTWSEMNTRLRRGAAIVATSDRELIPRNREFYPSNRIIPVPWIRKGRGIHGAWYYIKIRKIGNRIEYYFDNVLVLSYTDPKPLTGRHIAIWTQDNYVAFARAKISYAKRSEASPVVAAPKTRAADAIEGFSGPEANAYVKVSSPTHPGASFEFEGSLDGWRNVGGAQGAFLEVDTTTRNSGKSSLKVTNIETGGQFALRVPVEGLRLDNAILDFSYRFGPDAKVNLYLKLNDPFDRWYWISLTGPMVTDARMVYLGSVRKRADGRWRRATFNIGEALKRVNPTGVEFRVKEMRIGYLHEGYLRAGIGGNHKGTTYHLDGFHIGSYGPAKAKLHLALSNGQAKGFSTLVSRSREATAPAKVATTKALVSAVPTSAKTGMWYGHVRARDDKGRWTPATHFPFYVSPMPAKSRISPAEGSKWGGAPIYVYLQPRAGIRLAPDTVRVTANGQRLDTHAKAVVYFDHKSYAVIRAAYAPIQFRDGQAVEFAFDAWTEAGEHIAERWRYTYSTALDKWPPTNVRLLDYPPVLDFEKGDAGVQPLGGKGGAELSIDPRNRAPRNRSRASLKGTNVYMGGSAGVLLSQRWLSLGRNPVITFDYRMPKTYRLNLLLDPGGQQGAIQLTDPEKRSYRYPMSKLGAIEDAAADDTWRHAEVNVAELVRSRPVSPAMFDVSQIAFGDTGYQGVGPNMEFHLDNFAVVPTVSFRAGVRLRWAAQDPSGIDHYTVGWSTNARSPGHRITIPGDVTEKTFTESGLQKHFRVKPEGDLYFHLSAVDTRGRSSAWSSYRFIVDSTAPRWGEPTPAPGTRSAATKVTIPFEETGSGIDVSSLEFELNGRRFKPGYESVTVDLKKGALTWDWSKARPRVSVPHGAEVRCAANGVRDFAGNLSPRIEWAWTMDYSQDTARPAAPGVVSKSRRVLTRDTFEDGLGEWMFMSPLYYYNDVARVQISTNPSNHCVQIRNRYRRNNFGVYARTTPFRADEYPIISFDYDFLKGVMVDMMVQVNGEMCVIKLTAPKEQHRVIGRVDGFAADSRWRRAVIDLRPMLRKAFPKQKTWTIETIGFGDFGENANSRRAYYRIDNFMIAAPGAAAAEFAWDASDLTGIQGYRVALDQAVDTTPTAASSAKRLAKTLTPGVWYLHVQAQDGAGNWGGVTHYPYVVPGPKGR